MSNLIILRIHPVEPTKGSEFKDYLNGLAITAYDLSFANAQEGAKIGQARYLPDDPEHNRITQHAAGNHKPQAVASAVIEVPTAAAEYDSRDIRLEITRGGKEIVHRGSHYNVAVSSRPLPNQLPRTVRPNRFPRNLLPPSLYLAVPPPGSELDPELAHVEMPLDGTPPAFDELEGAVAKELAKDPGTGKYDLANLTLPQCRHIAHEIVWNRGVEAPPEPRRSLEDMYTGKKAATDEVEQDRLLFEAELRSYTSTNNAEAERLSRFVYSLSAAFFCENRSRAAERAGFRLPIGATAAEKTLKIREAEVVLVNP